MGTAHPLAAPCTSLFHAIGAGDVRATTTAEVIQGVGEPDLDLAPFVARTDGVSAAFIREVVRRAALGAAEAEADAGAAPIVGGPHLDAALDDLIEHSAPVLRSMLGAAPTAGQ